MLTAFIIFFTSKINLTTIFLHNQAYGITPNLSDFMAFRVAFVYYEFLSWQCLLDGNLQLFVEVVSCRSCRWVFFFFLKVRNNVFRGMVWNSLQNLLNNSALDHTSAICTVFFLFPVISLPPLPIKQWAPLCSCLWQGLWQTHLLFLPHTSKS